MTKGTKVRFLGANDAQISWENFRNPSNVLKKGTTYVVEEVSVYSKNTGIKLEGIDGEFNSSYFEEVFN